MIGVDGYCRSLCGTKVQQSMQCATLLIACALFSPIAAFGSEVSLSANPPSCSPEQSLRKRAPALMKSPRDIQVTLATFGLGAIMRFARPRHVLRLRASLRPWPQ